MSNHRPKAMITRVRLENYKSIKSCDVQLEPLTFLVGPNGSGKSNFLDALSFVSDALQYSFDYAISSRSGGKRIIFHQSSESSENIFNINLEFTMTNELHAVYNLSVKVASENNQNDFGSEIIYEECRISNGDFFCINNNSIKTNIEKPPKVSNKHLYLVRISSIDNFNIIFNHLSGLDIYNPSPVFIKSRKIGSTPYKVSKDADNLFITMQDSHFLRSINFSKVDNYLSKIVQNYAGIELRYDTVPDVGILQNSKNGEAFWSQNLSDGTLRAIAILFILFQKVIRYDQGFLLIGIEEPELALHPAATSVLLDAMREASQNTQILVTTHSPDLLDNVDLENGDELVLAVDSRDGQTIIAPIDAASREIVHRKLFGLGDLLRMNQLEPEITKPKFEEHV